MNVLLLTILMNVGCLQMDILLVGDVSGSTTHKMEFIEESFKAFANRFELADNGIRVGAMLFDDEALLLCPITSNKERLLNSLDSIDNYNGGTNITNALTSAANVLELNKRRGVPRIIILVSDGGVYDDGLQKALLASEIIQLEGIFIYGVYVDSSSGNPKHMYLLATPGHYMSTSYESLIQTLEELDICF